MKLLWGASCNECEALTGFKPVSDCDVLYCTMSVCCVWRASDVDGTEVQAHGVRRQWRQQLSRWSQLSGCRLQPGHRVSLGVVQQRTRRSHRSRLLCSPQWSREAAVGGRSRAVGRHHRPHGHARRQRSRWLHVVHSSDDIASPGKITSNDWRSIRYRRRYVNTYDVIMIIIIKSTTFV